MEDTVPLYRSQSSIHSTTLDDGLDGLDSSSVKYSKYYSLPALRYTNVIRIILFIDAAFTISLWASGGNKKYFVDNILNFHFTESTFDLALITTFKCVLLFVMYTELENATSKQIEQPNNTSRKKSVLHAFIIFLSLLSLAYSTVKGGLILNALLNAPNYEKMHLTYNILTISSAAFGLLEFITSLFSFLAMNRVRKQRILHRLNSQNQEVDESGETIKSGTSLRRLITLIRHEGGIISLACLCLLGSTASQTAAPLFFGMVVDAAQKSMEDLNRTVVILLIIQIAGAIVSMFRATLFTLAGQRMVARLRKKVFHHIILQEIAFFDTNRTGELTNRLASDTEVVQNAVTVNVSMLARYLLQIIGSLVFMFVLNASLTGVLLAVVPLISLGAVQYGKFVMKVRKTYQDRLADASATAEESISNIRTVRSFVGEGRANGLYGESVDKSYAEGKRLALASGSFSGVIGLIVSGAIALVLWYGGKLVYEKQISPGVLTSFLLYTLNVAFAFGLLSSLFGDFMQAVGASTRIFELFDRVPVIPNTGGDQPADLPDGLEFDKVDFTYPARPDNKVLKEVTFSIDRGQMVALVGPSGGGKSTIVSLIERFYDPNSGTVRLGGLDLKELDPQWFRRKISIVSQEPLLFACSIKDNITYGRDSTFEEVVEAAKQANAHEFISQFEDGYDTTVGERGVRLSGGQKQRVAIARALIMNPDILLLDEATSALDAESEYLVQEAIDRAMVDRTVLIIAHRLSTVRNASKVVVINKGEVVEQGTHDELLAKQGVYKKLVLRQLTAGQTSDLTLGGAVNTSLDISLEDSTEQDPKPNHPESNKPDLSNETPNNSNFKAEESDLDVSDVIDGSREEGVLDQTDPDEKDTRGTDPDEDLMG